MSYDRLLKAAGTSGCFQVYFVVFTGVCNLLSSLLITGLPFLEKEPAMECLRSNGEYTVCTKEEACHLGRAFRVSHAHPLHNFITDFRMECSTPYHIGLIGSCFFLGYMAGSIVFAPLADLIGRKRVIILGVLVFAMTMVYMLFFAASPEALYLGMFLVGFRSSANTQIVYVMITEYTDPSSRVYYCIACNLLESLMNAVTALFYSAGGHYRYLYWFGGAVSLILVAWTHFLIPESPRFLNTRPRTQAGLEDFRLIARFNGRLDKVNALLSSDH